jgi:hypothetical protein
MTKNELEQIITQLNTLGVSGDAVVTFKAVGAIPADSIVPIAFGMKVIGQDAEYSWNGGGFSETVSEINEIILSQG